MSNESSEAMENRWAFFFFSEKWGFASNSASLRAELRGKTNIKRLVIKS